MNTKKLKAFHFVLSWLGTLFIGLVIGAVFFNPSISLLTTAVAAICSLPFISVFALLMHRILKNDFSKAQVHMLTFGMHFIGSLLVFFVIITLGTVGSEQGALLLLMAGYFLLDSIFFHIIIQTMYKEVHVVRQHEDILDDFELT